MVEDRKHMRKRRTGWLTAGCLAAAALPAFGQIVSFQNLPYKVDQTLTGVDGWTKPSSNNYSDFFMVRSAGADRFVRYAATDPGMLLKDFTRQTGLVDLRWRWRSSGDSVRICVGAGNAVAVSIQNAGRAYACLEGFKLTGVGQLTDVAPDKLVKDAWYYMRLRVDIPKGLYSLYLAADSLRGDEKLEIGPAVLTPIINQINNNVARAVLRAEKNSGAADIDDIDWEPVSIWTGGASDSGWHAAGNWNGPVPDTNTHVVFDGTSQADCHLRKPAGVRTLTLQKEYTGAIDLDSSYLAVFDNADLAGAGGYKFDPKRGFLMLASPRGQSLIPPAAGKNLPPIYHAPGGALRLDGNLYATGFRQDSATLDFHGHDLSVEGSLLVTKGGPYTFANLAGRSIVATKSAQLDGSAGSLLNLSTAGDKPWHISVHDSLKVHFAEVGNSAAGDASGYAFQSIDRGSNINWIIAAPPAVTVQPRADSVLIGRDARFTASVNSKIAFTLQWLVDDNPAPGATDSVFTVKGVRLAHRDSIITCRAVNAAGPPVFSLPARIVVLFPAPVVDKPPQVFADSLRIRVTSTVPNASLILSINGGPWQASSGGLLLTDSATVAARAVLNGDTGDAAVWTYPVKRLQQAAMPDIKPEATGFDDSISVTLLPITPGSRIFYTRDGSAPDTTSAQYTAPFTLRATTTVSAMATAAGFRASPVRTRIYIRNTVDTLPRPPHPTAAPAGAFFGDSLLVKLTHPEKVAIYYCFYDSAKSPNWIRYDTAGILLKETTLLRAFAVRGTNQSGISDTAEWAFARQLEAPVASPKSRDFPDSLLIQLSSKSGATIRYTLDGSPPDRNSKVYGGSILIDSSAVLNAAVFKNGIAASAVQTEIYHLVPAAPKASPKGGDFAAGVTVALAASSPKARIYYTLDGSTPAIDSKQLYSGPFPLDTNATLKAVAVSGQGADLFKGQILIENYVFFAAGKRTLNPGQRLDLTSNYSLSNPAAGGSKVEVEVISKDSLATLRGFGDVQFGIRISLGEGATSFPPLYFNEPLGEERLLYEITPAGVQYVSGDDTAKLPETGVYFLGTDTVPPTIAVSKEIFVPGDSTKEIFTVQDNVINLMMDLERSDAPEQNVKGSNIGSQDIITVVMKAKASPFIAPLTLRMRIDDHNNVAAFPADTATAYEVAQKISSVRSPPSLRIGNLLQYPWDLVSIPLELDKPATLAELRANNAAAGLAGMVWDAGAYRYLRDDEPIAPGKSVWLGMQSSLASLAFPEVQTVPHYGKNTYHVTLHTGWNQISNPSLTPLYWPYTRRITEVLDASPIKSLHGYNGGGGWLDTDTLEPWKGYFVFYKGAVDVTVDLLSAPVKAPSAKRAAARAGLALEMSLGAFQRLRLGAAPGAEDGVGLEDEPQPPANVDKAPRLGSVRARQLLGTDLMRWTPGALYRWKVVAGLPASPPSLGNTKVTPRAALVDGLSLPPGYAAWAVSATRGLKFALREGGGVPLFPGFTDSLEILAGPAAELEARLASVPSSVEDFRVSVSPSRGRGITLHLRLPQALDLRWSLWTPAGRSAGSGTLHLAEGIYDLPLGGAGAAAPGLYLFHAEWTGDGPRGSFSSKLAIP